MSLEDLREDRRSLRALRDLGLLLFVAAALVAGLVHYTLARDDDGPVASPARPPTSSSTSSQAGSPASSPPSSPASSPASSEPSSEPSPQDGPRDTPGPLTTDPSATPSWTSSATTTSPTAVTTVSAAAVTCWDGTTAAALTDCAAPSGKAGLTWVFPTLARPGLACREARRPAGHYQVVVGRVCFTRYDGRPVTITFEQVASLDAATRAIEQAYPGAQMYDIPGADGGRSTWFDGSSSPARATGSYDGYPYVASLFAGDRRTARSAWSALVRFRDPADLLGRD